MMYALMGDLLGSPQIILDQIKLGTPVIHLGDIGRGQYLEPFLKVPREKFMLVAGNHDELPLARRIPGFLGDFGEIKENVGFVRGAYSIDKIPQQLDNIWDENEELSELEACAFLSWYEETKPRIMLSHDIPSRFSERIHQVHIKSKTGNFLDIAYQIHKPEKWYAGHHHQSLTMIDKDFELYLLGENEVLYVDL